MKSILYIGIMLISATTFAQTDFSTSSDSDPKATKILDALKSQYEGYAALTVDFALDIEIPEELIETQEGKIIQSGDKFMLDMPQQTIYSNGTILWLHLKEMNEVQINDVEDDEGESAFLSPKEILNLYESGAYVYSLINEGEEGKDWITQIEFKPLDKDSEYSKLRLTLKDKNTSIKRLKVFSKDGSRFTMKINNLSSDNNLEDEVFEFNTEAHPDIIVEDLRL